MYCTILTSGQNCITDEKVSKLIILQAILIEYTRDQETKGTKLHVHVRMGKLIAFQQINSLLAAHMPQNMINNFMYTYFFFVEKRAVNVLKYSSLESNT